ncbi:ZIP family metal transporter [Sphingomonas sp. GB1N7]|uniref:ZIP family metal transporter n=1 Tax=Parasphingomonas caseinilytica TaxID=3096158 RepID=UPI002FC641DC
MGGILAIRFRSAQGFLFRFSSGAVIGVALLDLLPEAFDLVGTGRSALTVMTATACGFAGYLLLDRSSLILFGQRAGHGRHLGPGSLSMHSLIDGLGIGLAFQVSSAAGIIVAIAVLAHDFMDGANTVTLTFAGGGGVPTARAWLVVDALAPLAGIVLARSLAVPAEILGLLLALFAGGFLYIGASELLPRSRDGDASFARVGATGLGLAFIYVVVRLAGR